MSQVVTRAKARVRLLSYVARRAVIHISVSFFTAPIFLGRLEEPSHFVARAPVGRVGFAMGDSGSEESDDGWLDDCSSDDEPPVVQGLSSDAQQSAPSVLAGSSARDDGTDSRGNNAAPRATDGWGVEDEAFPRARASAPLADDAHREPPVGAAETDAPGGVPSNARRKDEAAETSDAYLDFSVKSPWERLSRAVETAARAWLRLTDRELRARSTVNDSRPDHGSRDLRCLRAVIEHDQTHWRRDPYAVLLYFRDDADAERPNVLRRREDGLESAGDDRDRGLSETGGHTRADTGTRKSTRRARASFCVSQRATCAPEEDLSPGSVGLQRWFGAAGEGGAPFAVVEPLSPRLAAPPFRAQSDPFKRHENVKSGTFADVDEATAAKAAVAVAFAAAGVPGHWPVFAPVLGPARRAFVGRTGDADFFGADAESAFSNEKALTSVGGWSVRYETDSLEGVAAEKASARTAFGLCDALRAQLAALHGAHAADALAAEARVTARLAFVLTEYPYGRRRRRSAYKAQPDGSAGSDDESSSSATSSSSDGEGDAVRAGDAFLAVAGGARPPRLRGKRVERNEAEAEAEAEKRGDETAPRDSKEKETLRWDDVTPWAPWATVSDPWRRVEVHATYRQVPIESLRDESRGLSLEAAPEWTVRAVPRGAADATGAFVASAFPSDFPVAAGALREGDARGVDADGCSGESLRGDESRSRDRGLAELYYLLSKSVVARAARDAETMGRLASAEFWDDEAATGVSPPPRAPPESVVQDVLRDIFSDAERETGGEGGGAARAGGATKKTSSRERSPFPRLARSAPPDSLLARLALHALVFGNARAVATLWRRFVREIRFAHWDRGVPLPRTGGVGFEATLERSAGTKPGPFPDDRSLPDHPLPEDDEDDSRVFRDEQVDMNACVAHQKIQLINACIRRRKAGSVDEYERSDAAREIRRDRAARVCSGGWDDIGGGWDDENDATTGTTARAIHAPRGDAFNGGRGSGDDRKEKRVVAKSPDDDIDLVALLGVATPPPPPPKPAPKNNLSAVETDGFETASDDGDDEGLAADEQDDVISGVPTRAPEGAKRAHPDGLRLLRPPHREMNVPETQPPPLFTEDVAREREAAMHALGDTPEGRALRVRLQSDQLVSDMSAFKAANPGSCLADFVRWHSPRDWVEDREKDAREKHAAENSSTLDARRTDALARGSSAPNPGKLSARMGSQNNTWKTLWRDAPIVPASKQKPLFDPIREGERALEYLDTAPPPEIFAQILAAAAAAVGETYAEGASFLAIAGASVQRTVDAPSREALRRAHAMAAHTLARACPYEEEYAAVAGELQRAERAVARSLALAFRMPGVCAELRERLLAAAAEDEDRADAEAAETAEEQEQVSSAHEEGASGDTPRRAVSVPRPPPRVVEAVLPRTHPERRRGSPLARLVETRGFEPGADASESAAHAEYVVRAGGGHAQTHRAHAVVAPCFIRVSSAVAYQY